MGTFTRRSPRLSPWMVVFGEMPAWEHLAGDCAPELCSVELSSLTCPTNMDHVVLNNKTADVARSPNPRRWCFKRKVIIYELRKSEKLGRFIYSCSRGKKQGRWQRCWSDASCSGEVPVQMAAAVNQRLVLESHCWWRLLTRLKGRAFGWRTRCRARVGVV